MLAGSIPKEDVTHLITELLAAGTGPAAEDAGYLEIHFRNSTGAVVDKAYSMPRADPAVGLLNKVDALAAKYGKKPG